MIRVILCRPEYQINLGMIARILQNFEVSDLYLVSPVARIGFEAIMFAKHGRKIIEDAKTVNSIEEAVKGCTLAVGTSGDVSKYKKKLKNSLPLKAAVEKTTTIAKLASVLKGKALCKYHTGVQPIVPCLPLIRPTSSSTCLFKTA